MSWLRQGGFTNHSDGWKLVNSTGVLDGQMGRTTSLENWAKMKVKPLEFGKHTKNGKNQARVASGDAVVNVE